MATLGEARHAWASQSWEAEVENARRLETRVNLILTLALAFAGGSATVLADALATHANSVLALGCLIGAGVGALLLLAAFVWVLLVKVHGQAAHKPFASSHLLIGAPGASAIPVRGVPGATRRTQDLAFFALVTATWDLNRRNANEKRRLDQAQQLFLAGAVAILLFGGVYTWLKGSPSPTVEVERTYRE